MATTALIVEIIVIGVFGLIWVGLFVFRLFNLDVAVVSNWFAEYKDWSTGIVLLLIAVSYQLGWSVNQLSYFVARKTFNKAIKKKVFKNDYENYDHIKATVFIKASTFVLDSIRERLSVVRLTRSAFINFLLISIAVFALGNLYLGLVVLGITIILFIQANDIYTLYCNQIFNAYRVINQNIQAGENKVKNEKRKTSSHVKAA